MADERIHAGLPSMRSVGYRQALNYLDGSAPDDDWMYKAIVATRQLAKRQFTWIRGMESLTPLACDSLDTAAQLEQALVRVNKHV